MRDVDHNWEWQATRRYPKEPMNNAAKTKPQRFRVTDIEPEDRCSEEKCHRPHTYTAWWNYDTETIWLVCDGHETDVRRAGGSTRRNPTT